MPRSRQRDKKIKQMEPEELLLPSGCTLFNCACSGSPFGAYPPGRVINIIGDSSAGKTILTYTGLAEMAHNKIFDEYRLIVDQAEYGEDFDREKLFGRSFNQRVEPPNKLVSEDGEPIYSETIQDFQMNVMSALENPRPFVYLLDSFDALDSEGERKKIEDKHKKWKKGTKDDTGSYGGEKPKKASELLRQIRGKIKHTKSVLIIISQVRDSLNAGLFSPKKTRSGGKALKFYSWYEIWLYLGKKIKAKDTMVGVNTIASWSKNRQTGKLRQVEYPIYYDLGIDDITANIMYLIKTGFIKKNGKTLHVPEINFNGGTNELVRHIEKNNLERKIQEMVGTAWNEFEDSLKLNRKKRFA